MQQTFIALRNALFILIAFLFIGCKSGKPNLPEISADEYAVINAAIKYRVPSIAVFRDSKLFFYRDEPRFPPPGFKWTAKDTKRQKMMYDSVSAMLDTAKLHVTISRDMDKFPGGYLKGIKRGITKYFSDARLRNIVKLKLIALAGDTLKHQALLSPTKIHPIRNYKTSFYSGRYARSEILLGPGNYSFSRVSFDRSKQLAAIYTGNYCGPRCGTGMILFLEKVNGDWQVFDVFGLWIA